MNFKMPKIPEKIFDGNLVAAASGFLITKANIIQIPEFLHQINQEEIVKVCLTISSITAAIWGVYRVIKLCYDGITALIKKFKRK